MVGSAAAQAVAAPMVVADYTVFVDPPTGFVFVKLPRGWKFAGRISEHEVARLPSTVMTTVLPRREPDAAGHSVASTATEAAETPR